MTRIYTSNWSNRQTQHMIRVRISLTMPKGCTVHESLMEAAPGWQDLLGPHKQGLISDAEYTRRYRALLEADKDRILEAFDAIVALHPGSSVVLLCRCRKGTFCHRCLLAQWLEEQGRGPIPEL